MHRNRNRLCKNKKEGLHGTSSPPSEKLRPCHLAIFYMGVRVSQSREKAILCPRNQSCTKVTLLRSLMYNSALGRNSICSPESTRFLKLLSVLFSKSSTSCCWRHGFNCIYFWFLIKCKCFKSLWVCMSACICLFVWICVHTCVW